MATLNLLQETEDIIKAAGKSTDEIQFVSSHYSGYEQRNDDYCGTWEEFKALANINYDNGFGGEEINTALMIVAKDWWLERHEYDGSEWWEFKILPVRPENALPLCKEAINNR